MRNSLDYAGLAQLCARSPIMRKIMRAHNRIIQPSLDQVWGRRKLEFKQIFNNFRNINASHRRILCTISMKFPQFVGSFLLGHILKFCQIRLRGLRIYGSFYLRGFCNPKIFSTPCASDGQMLWRCKNVLEVLYHLSKFSGTQTLQTSGGIKNVEFLSVLSVTLLNGKV